jgi:hypothetical protein
LHSGHLLGGTTEGQSALSSPLSQKSNTRPHDEFVQKAKGATGCPPRWAISEDAREAQTPAIGQAVAIYIFLYILSSILVMLSLKFLLYLREELPTSPVLNTFYLPLIDRI